LKVSLIHKPFETVFGKYEKLKEGML